MNKTIEKPFLALFGGLTSPAAHCLEWMDETYDLGVYPAKQPREPLPPKWRDYFDNVLPQTIKTRVEAFDETVVMCGNPSPLMEEIENNLNEQPTQEAKERYLFSLLIPFKELADKYTPVALIAQEERQIQETEKDLAYWKQQPQDMELTNTAGKPSGTVKGQVEACCSMISRHRQQIERYKHISDQYRILTGRCEDGARWMQKDTVEAYLHTLHSIAFHFANRLDALLLTYGIDLLRLELESGVFLKEHRLITDVDYYIGSRELAQKYIDALPKAGNSQPQQEAPELPKELNTDKARGLIAKAVEAGYITVEAGQYKWNGEKVLLAYFAVKATTYLGLKKNYNAYACWKPFERLFNVANLKEAKADYEKYHSDFHPTGYEKIDTLFEADTEGQK